MDRVFVETIGGDLTVKVEDNAEDGRDLLRAVDHPTRPLMMKYAYADLGNLILLRIRPYQEKTTATSFLMKKCRKPSCRCTRPGLHPLTDEKGSSLLATTTSDRRIQTI